MDGVSLADAAFNAAQAGDPRGPIARQEEYFDTQASAALMKG
jgi:hypothetical protein